MATQKQSRNRRLNMTERARQQMEIQFPDYANELLWQRKVNDGYSTIPRTLPLAMQSIDAQSKGQPAGHTDRVPGRGVRVAQEVMDSGMVGMPIRRSRRTG